MSSEVQTNNSKTLYYNNITSFILRIDFDRRFKYDIDEVTKTFLPQFPKKEKRFSHQRVNFRKYDSEVKVDIEDIANTVLIDDSKKCSLMFSPEPPSIIFESRRYVSNDIYKQLFQEISEYFSSRYPDELSVRIGMRYINTFDVNSDRDISKYLAKTYSSLVRSISKKEQLCRTLIQQETIDDGNHIRVLYGMLNKYYPSVLVSKDLTIDIDSFAEAGIPFNDWSKTLEELNHAAYNAFIEMMNPQYINSLKEKNV